MLLPFLNSLPLCSISHRFKLALCVRVTLCVLERVNWRSFEKFIPVILLSLLLCEGVDLLDGYQSFESLQHVKEWKVCISYNNCLLCGRSTPCVALTLVVLSHGGIDGNAFCGLFVVYVVGTFVVLGLCVSISPNKKWDNANHRNIGKTSTC